MSEVFLKKLFLKTLCILRKAYIRESNLSKDAPATLLKSLSAMVDSWEFSKSDKK